MIECISENRLTYSIVEGNENGAFEVAPDVGEIRVRGQLDYEQVSLKFGVREKSSSTSC